MKKFEIWKIAFVILFSTVLLSGTETVSAKGLLAKKKREAAAVQENAPAAAPDASAIAANSQIRSEISKQEAEKKGTAGKETVSGGNTVKKKNPFTEFFDNLMNSRKTKAENRVELPSEHADPSSAVQTTGRSESRSTAQLAFSDEAPKDEKPPFEPAYGVDKSEKHANSENIPDQIVLEGTSSNAHETARASKDSGSAASADPHSKDIPQNAPLKPGIARSNTQAQENDSELSEIPDSIRLENHQNETLAAAKMSQDAGDSKNDRDPYTAVPDTQDENPNSWILESASELPEQTADQAKTAEQAGAADPSDQKQDLQRKEAGDLNQPAISRPELAEERDDLEKMPPIPTKRALKGMDPDESLDSAYVRTANADQSGRVWNQEIPELEFMEQNDARPILNVSPQRLASPLDRRNATATELESQEADTEIPLPLMAEDSAEGKNHTETHIEASAVSNSALPTELPSEMPGTGDLENGNQNEDSFSMLAPPPLETSTEIGTSVGSAVQISGESAPNFRDPLPQETADPSDLETEWNENFGLLPSPLEENDSEGTPAQNTAKERAELKVSTRAPKNVLVGVETQFQIQVRNVSPLVSNGTNVEIAIPKSFTVKKALTSRGAAVILRDPDANIQRCVWNLETLPASAQESLVLKVVPTETVSADLRVSWSNRHAEDRQIMVAELPKLQMELIPETMIREGEENRVKIRVANTGNCIARNIVLQMETEGCADLGYAIEGIPSLLPGSEEIVEAVFTPTTRGKVKLCVSAQIQNQTHAEVEKFFDVHFIDMNVQIEEPESSFAGMQSKIPVQIRNLGNTQATDLKMSVEIPENARFAGTEPKLPYVEAGQNLIVLDLPDTPEGHSQYFRLLMEFNEACSAQIPFTLQSDANILSETQIPIRIEGISNVEMKLNFPERVLSTSENGIYEIQLTNTGSKVIENGQLFAYFSDGIEPNSTNQSTNIMNGGIVSFDVPSLMPGETRTFQIHANARSRGDYAVRCQFQCEKAGLDLIQQEVSIYR